MINFNPVIEDPPTEDEEYPASMSPLIFTSKNEKLIGTVFLTSGVGPHPTVLILHGCPGNELNHDIAQALRRYGFNVVVFHYRGSWGSSGNFSFANSLEDVSAAIEFLNSENAYKNYRIDKEKIILIGHSFGGFAALLNSVNYKNIKNIASLAGFNFGYFAQFTEQYSNIKDATMEGLSLGAELLKDANPQFLYNEMLNNQIEWDLLNLDSKLKDKNILLVAAENDMVCPTEIHHFPLVQKLKSTENKITDTVIKSGHSFSCCRIKLTQIIIDLIKESDLVASK